MTQSKLISRWISLAFIGVFATGLLYLALSGQPSIYG